MPEGPPTIRCSREALDAIRNHVVVDLSVEHGGILVGQFDSNTIEVVGAVPAYSATSTATSLTFTPDAWDEIERGRVQRFPQQQVVGWYHSHPNYGIFLSRHDTYIHENFFTEPFQVAYVIDPINDCDGFFSWEDGELRRSPDWQRPGSNGRWQMVTAMAAPVGEPVRPATTGPPPVPAPPAGSAASGGILDSVPMWVWPAAIALAFVVGGLLGRATGGGGAGDDVPLELPGLAAEATVIVEATGDRLADLLSETPGTGGERTDQTPDASTGQAALEADLEDAVDDAIVAIGFAELAARVDPSPVDAMAANDAADELRALLQDANLLEQDP